MKTSAPKSVRVAVYVRQSVEDARSPFGSIQAQVEAVRAYVVSQRGAGWVALPESYEDAGFSGATIERPAFARLLDDVKAGRVDVVAVYRLDRFSRSMADFTQLMRLFHEHAVEFVSITEQFNTTIPGGRMFMHLLAIFAEFERETIAQRTRDKMGAARRKGMWTGGRPPLGYDPVERKLVVNLKEAELVRTIFTLYAELGSLMATVNVLNQRGWRTKTFTTAEGKRVEGGRFNKSNLRDLLRSPLYVGQMRAGEETVEGAHEAIVEREVWDAAQAALTRNGRRGGCDRPNRHGMLLRGLLVCGACGSPMRSTFAGKDTKRYQYYVCGRALEEGAAACPRGRVSAGQIEGFVLDQVRAIGRDPVLARQTIAAAKGERERRIPELEAEARRHQVEERRLCADRAKLVAAVADAGPASGALLARVGELDQHATDAAKRAVAAREALMATQAGVVDEAGLRSALADFDVIWTELFPRERTRVLALLIEKVTFLGTTGDVAITFRANGLRSLTGAA